MFKVILDQEQHKQLTEKIKSNTSFKIIDNHDGLNDHEIGIICEEKDIELIKPILKEIEFEKAQMVFQTVEGWVQIYIHKITYLESFGDEIEMHMVNHDKEIIKQPLYQLEEILEPYQFARIAKSFIVNLRKVRYIKVTYNAKLELELTNGDKIYVSRSYVSKFKHALGIK